MLLPVERCAKQLRGLCTNPNNCCTFDNISIKYNNKGEPVAYSLNNSKCSWGYEPIINIYEIPEEKYSKLISEIKT